MSKVIRLELPTVTINLPDTKSIKEKLSLALESFSDSLSEVSTRTRRPALNLTGKWSDIPKRKKRFLFLFLAALILTVTAIRVAPFLARSKPPADSVAGTKAKHIDVNREFQFPLRDGDDEVEDAYLKYVVVGADLTDQIIVQGKMATAASGRQFLILNLKLENPTQTPLSIKTRDFVRITPEGSEDRLAPDIHNDPADVQPISTKLTRVGFPVDEKITNFTLYVGEINGEKQEISLNF